MAKKSSIESGISKGDNRSKRSRELGGNGRKKSRRNELDPNAAEMNELLNSSRDKKSKPSVPEAQEFELEIWEKHVKEAEELALIYIEDIKKHVEGDKLDENDYLLKEDHFHFDNMSAEQKARFLSLLEVKNEEIRKAIKEHKSTITKEEPKEELKEASQEKPVSEPELQKEEIKNEVLAAEAKSEEKIPVYEGELIHNEENISYENDKKIIELGKKLEVDRNNYVKRDMAVDKASSIFKKFFGLGKGGQLGQINEEFESAKTEYENSLKNYLDEIMATQIMDKEEAEIMADYVARGEYINLFNVRTDIKAENSNWPDKIKDGYLKLAKQYRELPIWKKLAYGGAIAATGFGAGAVGGAFAAGTVLTASRLFSMSVSAVGFKQMFQGLAEKSRENKSQKTVAEILRNSKTEGIGEMRLNLVKENLNNKIKEIDEQIQKRKSWDKKRTWAAIGTGVALSFAAKYVGKEIIEFFKENVNLNSDHEINKFLADKPKVNVETEIPKEEITVSAPEEIQKNIDVENNNLEQVEQIKDDQILETTAGRISPEEMADIDRQIAEQKMNDVVEIDSENSAFGRNVEDIMGDLDRQIDFNAEEITHGYTHTPEEIEVFKERIADLGYSRGFMEKFSQAVFHGNQTEATKTFRSAIMVGENWDKIKGLNFNEAAKGMNWRASDKMNIMFGYLKNILGSEVKPGNGETLEKWTERVAKLAVEKAK